MRNKKLMFVLLGLLSFSTHAISTSNTSSAPITSMDQGSSCTDDPDNSWEQDTSYKNGSYGYLKFALGYSGIHCDYTKQKFINTQKNLLGNPEFSGLENPNYGQISNDEAQGMNLYTDSKNSTMNGVEGACDFGYNAALGQGPFLVGFFAGVNIRNASSKNIPITLELQDYRIDYTGDSPVVDEESLHTVTQNFQTKISSVLSYNAGLMFGCRLGQRAVVFLKGGWTCLRMTCSKQNDKTTAKTDEKKNTSSYIPSYSNGFTYGGGIDILISERTSIGVEAFGNFYPNKDIALCIYQSNAGGDTTNSATAIGTTGSTQKLMASPMSVNSWGVMATFKINFLER